MNAKYLQMKFAETIGRFMPRKVGYGIARRFADGYVLCDRRGREAVINNLQRIHAHTGVTLSRRALRALARESGDARELVFFPRLRRELRTQLQNSPRVVRFRGLRGCVKQLAGARRWSRCAIARR